MGDQIDCEINSSMGSFSENIEQLIPLTENPGDFSHDVDEFSVRIDLIGVAASGTSLSFLCCSMYWYLSLHRASHMCSNDARTYLHVIALILYVGCVDGVVFLLTICEGQMSCITLSTLSVVHILKHLLVLNTLHGSVIYRNCLSTDLLLLMVIVVHTH